MEIEQRREMEKRRRDAQMKRNAENTLTDQNEMMNAFERGMYWSKFGSPALATPLGQKNKKI